MSLDLMKEHLEKYIKLLPVGTSISYTEAEKRAGSFIEVQSWITNVIHILSAEKIKLLSVQTATYAQEMSKCTAKTVTENKLTTEASAEYVKAREDFESLENDLRYFKSHYEIFNNAHIFYRGMAKGDNG